MKVLLAKAIGNRPDEAVSFHATQTPNTVLIRENDKTWSAHDFNRLIDALAMHCAAHPQISKGVGIYLENSATAIALLLACFRLHVRVVLINIKYDEQTVEHIIQDANIGLLVTTEGLRHKVHFHTIETVEALPIFRTSDTAQHKTQPPIATLGDDSPALVYYTSGSTGKPKGIQVSNCNLMFGIDSVTQYLNLHFRQKLGAVLPFSFDAGLNWILSGLNVGAETHLLRFIFPHSFAQDIATYQVEALLAVPSVFYALSQVKDTGDGNPRLMACTGGRVDTHVVRQLKHLYDSLDFVVMYGLTESFRSTYLPPALWENHPDSIGTPIPHAAVHIVTEAGCEAKTNEIGEIVHSGPFVSLGYLNRPDAQKQRFGPCPLTSPYAETHPIAVYSGDLGRKDANGLFYYLGRNDRMIKSRGYRIAPDEIEKAIVNHCGVSAAFVYGEDAPEFGQRIIAVLEGVGPTLAEMRNQLRSIISAFMLPDEIYYLSRFPLNPNGKIDAHQIKTLIK